jgi:hypothetical protein
VQYLGAKDVKDRNLLEYIANDFDVLITIDGTMQFQQNLKTYPRLAIILITTGDGSIKNCCRLCLLFALRSKPFSRASGFAYLRVISFSSQAFS